MLVSIHRFGFGFLVGVAGVALMMIGFPPTANSQAQKDKNERAKEAIAAVLRAHTDNWNRHDMDA